MAKKNYRTKDGKILIKKYGNRRLYSTFDSRYLTLKELEDLIRSGEDVQVVEASSEEDITSQVLTQILVESDQSGRLPVQFLQKVIRQGDSFLDSFLERQGNRIERGMDTAVKTQADMMRMFQQMMSMGGMWPNPFLQARPDPQNQQKDEEIRRLRERIERMEAQLKKER